MPKRLVLDNVQDRDKQNKLETEGVQTMNQMDGAGRESLPLEAEEAETWPEADRSLSLEGKKYATALLCATEQVIQKINPTLRQLSFRVTCVADPELAMARLKYEPFDLVIIDEMLDISRDDKPVPLELLRKLPMSSIRRSPICLLSNNLPSDDGLEAFRQGVDLIVNHHEMEGRLQQLLRKSIREHKMLYAVFMDELERKSER